MHTVYTKLSSVMTGMIERLPSACIEDQQQKSDCFSTVIAVVALAVIVSYAMSFFSALV
jgi:hypothetical protein